VAGHWPPAEAVISALIALGLSWWIADLFYERHGGRLQSLRRDLDAMAVDLIAPPESARGAAEMRDLSRAIAALWPIVEAARAHTDGARQDLAGRALAEELALAGRDTAREIAAASRRLREALAAGSGSAAARSALDGIDLAAARLRLFAAMPAPRRATVSLNEAVDICVKALQPAAQASGGSLHFAPDGQVRDIPVDPDLFHRLLLDLILHAWAPARSPAVERSASEAGAPSGGRRVELRTHAEEDAVAISVRDDGESLPADQLRRIFQPFQSGHPRASGLGLALVRKIALAHGGSIAAANVMPHGVEITVRLPSSAQGSSAL
jgi:signal transduction histidine kinase